MKYSQVKQIVDRSANLNIEWNPREIYRQYLQKAETTTGVQTDLKHDATIEEALDLSEVREILTDNLSSLCTLVESFLNAITSSGMGLFIILHTCNNSCLFLSFKLFQPARLL